jgi:hypothetical protein
MKTGLDGGVRNRYLQAQAMACSAAHTTFPKPVPTGLKSWSDGRERAMTLINQPSGY